MEHDPEIYEFLMRHLKAIKENDIKTYHATTSEDLSLYEWWITPQRLDGLSFHDFIMTAHAQYGVSFGFESEIDLLTGKPPLIHYDLANLRIQRYGDTAIASYTMLVSEAAQGKVTVTTHNESRVMVKLDGAWKVVHVHKSPAWPAPHVQPKRQIPE